MRAILIGTVTLFAAFENASAGAEPSVSLTPIVVVPLVQDSDSRQDRLAVNRASRSLEAQLRRAKLAIVSKGKKRKQLIRLGRACTDASCLASVVQLSGAQSVIFVRVSKDGLRLEQRTPATPDPIWTKELAVSSRALKKSIRFAAKELPTTLESDEARAEVADNSTGQDPGAGIDADVPEASEDEPWPAKADPWVLHAEALLAEHDGDREAAIALLQEAVAESAEPEFKFDLERLTSRGQALETTVVKQVLTPPSETDANGVFARVQTDIQVDSNISVLPDPLLDDTTSRLQGVRGGVSATLGYDLGWNRVALDFSHAAHLSDDPGLRLFDVTTLTGSTSGDVKLRDVDLSYRAGATQINTDGIEDFAVDGHFLRQADVRGRASTVWGAFRVGVYTSLALREFGVQNDEGGVNDRDGLRAEGGLSARARVGKATVSVQAGAQTERTQGDAQQEWGPTLLAAATTRIRPGISLTGALNYQGRFYPEGRSGEVEATTNEVGAPRERIDHRLMPSARITYDLTRSVALVGEYAYIYNNSNTFEYRRQLGKIGVQARW